MEDHGGLSRAQKMEKTYLPRLRELVRLCEGLPATPMMTLAKINVLIVLTMRYERIQLDRNLTEHPYRLVQSLVEEAVSALEAWRDITAIEGPEAVLQASEPMAKESLHRDLFEAPWTQFNFDEYRDRIERFGHRLDVNGLSDGCLAGKRCIDFGCGHGNFAHALVDKGAVYVLGIDFGREAIRYAEKARDAPGRGAGLIDFGVASVYDVPVTDESFDLVNQNGVFHHLEDEDRAYREVRCVLRNGEWLWIYTNGTGAISQDFWDAAREVLEDVPFRYIMCHLEYLNIVAHKRYHLGDGFEAVYNCTTWEEITSRLRDLGFADFRRPVGDFPIDFDHDVIAADGYGVEKFGSGDLRLLARKAD